MKNVCRTISVKGYLYRYISLERVKQMFVQADADRVIKCKLTNGLVVNII